VIIVPLVPVLFANLESIGSPDANNFNRWSMVVRGMYRRFTVSIHVAESDKGDVLAHQYLFTQERADGAQAS